RFIGAQAYAAGQDLVFAAGEYAPATVPGRWLLAHELTHVAQHQTHASHAPQPKSLISDPADAAEQQADSIADQVMSADEGSTLWHKDGFVAPQAAILPYRRKKGSQYFGRNDTATLKERTSSGKNLPWIKEITVDFDGSRVDTNPGLASVPAADRLMATGQLVAKYNKPKKGAPLPDLKTAVGGGSTISGLTDKTGASDSKVKRIEGVGYNATSHLAPGAVTLIPGTKYTADPDPTSPTFQAGGNMDYAVFFKGLQALHVAPDGLKVGSHACVHTPDPPMQQINYHSVEKLTRVKVTYSSATDLAKLCAARKRQTGKKLPPC
ncbi:MAG TPA: DUF4157 domain-containing protein, partial [Verrucomicrobiae bacterium]|nr:DUF4157 domain-containing protein [Verrucomicrobiae bacterium]